MALPARLNTTNADLTRTQDLLRQGMSTWNNSPLSGAVRIQGIVTVAGVAQQVTHGLNRTYQGYFVGRVQGSAQCVVYENSTFGGVTVDKTKAVCITPSAAATIDLWVY